MGQQFDAGKFSHGYVLKNFSKVRIEENRIQGIYGRLDNIRQRELKIQNGFVKECLCGLSRLILI
jgi:hypothetical protein